MRSVILLLLSTLLFTEPINAAKKPYTLKNGVLTILQNIPLTGIDTPWRQKRWEIKSVVVAEGVTKIDNFTFYELRSVTNIQISSTVQTIETECTFDRCDKLQSITISPNNPYIYDIDGKIIYTKDNTKLLASLPLLSGHLTLPETLTTIGDFALAGAEISSIEIPESVTKIGRYAFANCNNLKEVKIPSNIKNIEECTFRECSNLEKIEFSPELTSIEYGAFSGTNIEEVTIPATVSHMDKFAFGSCKRLRKITYNSVRCNTESADKHRRGGKVFANVASLKEFIIGESVREIPADFISGETTIGELVIPSTIERIGAKAFNSLKGVRRIVLPESITEIAEGTFDHCYDLQEIVIPQSVTTISKSAFSDCESLKSINLPNNLKNIGKCAFSDCDSITEIEIPANVEHIDELAFYGCKMLKTVKLNAANCSTEVSYNGYIFSNCPNLENFIFASNVKVIPQYFCSKTNIRSVEIPASVEEIGDGAFSYCRELESIQWSQNLKKIGASVFNYCEKLENIVIPQSVAYLGGMAIANIDNLKSVKILNPQMEHSMNSRTIVNVPNCTLIIPQGSRDNFDPLYYVVKEIVEE